MYKIIGADQKEYGPITADQLRQWITEGRVNSQTKVQVEGSAEWKLLTDIPEFAEELKRRVPPVPTTTSAPAARTSGMAIASLVLGICGLITCGITALVGLILGLVAMHRIKKSNGALGGSGLALAGTIVSAVFLLLIPLQAAVFLPALASAKAKAQTINCYSNLKQLGLAVRLYAIDHNDQFPSATNWCDAILQDAGTNTVFKCPAGNSGKRSHYAFNAKLGGMEESKVNPETVLLFETDGGWNVNGGLELLLTKPRHGLICVATADGSVQRVSELQLKNLRWDP